MCNIIGYSSYNFDPAFDNDMQDFVPTISALSSSVSCHNSDVLDLEENCEEISNDVELETLVSVLPSRLHPGENVSSF